MSAIYAEGKLKMLLTERRIEQIIGREGETATFLKRCLLKVAGLGGGFFPRQINRYC